MITLVAGRSWCVFIGRFGMGLEVHRGRQFSVVSYQPVRNRQEGKDAQSQRCAARCASAGAGGGRITGPGEKYKACTHMGRQARREWRIGAELGEGWRDWGIEGAARDARRRTRLGWPGEHRAPLSTTVRNAPLSKVSIIDSCPFHHSQASGTF